MIHVIHKLMRSTARAAAVALIPLFCAAATAHAQRVTHARLSAQVVDDAKRTSLVGAGPLVAHYGKDQGSLGANETLRDMKLVLRRGAAEKAALDDFLAQAQNPSSLSFHKWLTPEVFGQRFGASDEDISAVTTWLRQQGFAIDGTSNGRTVITFSGTEAQFKAAFRAEMHRYLVSGETRIANASTPSVPSALAPALVGIATLGNARFRPAHTEPLKAMRDTSGIWHRQDSAALKSNGVGGVNPQFTETLNGNYYVLVGPSDFAEMYGLKPVWNQGYKGSGQSIAIVAESNIAKSDVDAFRKAFNLPDTKLNVIVIGDDPGLDYTSGAEGEAVLDVEWAGATAPEADLNLLVSASTNTETGILVAAEYAIDHNLSPVLNLSWGACELGLQTSGNQYFEDLWAQAAAQGISVVVASGDGGSVACDQSQYYAQYGQQVNGIASPVNAIAVGGTDFPVNDGNSSSYWNKNNDTTSLQSVKSYVPESIWNDSCASPDVLAHAADFGLTETTGAQICNNEYTFLNTVGGGGGISLCTSSDGSDQSSCSGGYAAPAWQQGIASIGTSGKRHLPDVSFFAGDGIWASAYAFCEADASSDANDCINNAGEMTSLAAGGTSFGAPAFAGIITLLNQQQGARQGNISKYLYALAEKQFADPTQSSSCQSADGSNTTGCIFHDVIQGSNAEPCVLGSLVDLVSGTTCEAASETDYVGIAAGYLAGVGYDNASGLGSLNTANLLANWKGALSADSASVTTHKLISSTTIPYGAVTTAEIDVKAESGSDTPTGSAAFMSLEGNGSTLALIANSLKNGTTQVSFNALIPGVHHLYASYGGDAKFGASSSSPTDFTVARAATALSATASNSNVVAPNSVSILVQVQTDSTALNPTGSVVFTKHATGAALGSTSLTSYTSPTGSSWALASMKLSSTALSSGENVIDIAYAGDSNYLAAANTSVSVNFVPAYAVSSSDASLDIDLSKSSQAGAKITITSRNSAKIDPSSLLLACEGLTVSGLNCSFSSPVLDASGTATSMLTVTANNPQNVVSASVESAHPTLARVAAAFSIAGLFLFWGGRKRKHIASGLGAVVMVLSLGTVGVLTGCGSSSHTRVSTAVTNQLSVSSGSASYGTTITLTSTLSPVSNTAAPAGTVLFYDGSTVLGSAPVSGGKAQLTISTFGVGKHAITASYSGDNTFMPSTSTITSVEVTLTTSLQVIVRDTSGNTAELALPVSIH